MKKSLVIFPFLLSFGLLKAHAQSLEAAFSIGALSPRDTTGTPICIATSCPSVAIQQPRKISYQGALALRMADFKLLKLYAELPVLGTPSREARFLLNPVQIRKFSSVFLTPGVKLKLLPVSSISPFISAGVGFARFSGSEGVGFAGQFGGGIDLKTGVPFLAFRAELRDYVTGTPNAILLLGGRRERRHNLFAGGGLVLHF